MSIITSISRGRMALAGGTLVALQRSALRPPAPPPSRRRRRTRWRRRPDRARRSTSSSATRAPTASSQRRTCSAATPGSRRASGSRCGTAISGTRAGSPWPVAMVVRPSRATSGTRRPTGTRAPTSRSAAERLTTCSCHRCRADRGVGETRTVVRRSVVEHLIEGSGRCPSRRSHTRFARRGPPTGARRANVAPRADALPGHGQPGGWVRPRGGQRLPGRAG